MRMLAAATLQVAVQKSRLMSTQWLCVAEWYQLHLCDDARCMHALSVLTMHKEEAVQAQCTEGLDTRSHLGALAKKGRTSLRPIQPYR